MRFTIYPAIDLRGGKVVRLKQGDLARMTAYSDDPVETARRWLDGSANWLHVVNLDGAFGESDAANRSALEAILVVAKSFGARVQFGGGMRSLDAVGRVLDLGVSRGARNDCHRTTRDRRKCVVPFWRGKNCCWNRCTRRASAGAWMEG